MSTTIYTLILPTRSLNENKFNYVYQITEISTGIKYIGSRGTKKDDPLLDLKKYKSSTKNKCFSINQKLNPLNYHYEILSYHKTRKEATIEESRLHKLYDVKCNRKYYNRSNQTENGFSTSGLTVVKDKNNNILMASIDDKDFKNGKYSGINKEHVLVKDLNGNPLLVHKDEFTNYVGYLKNKVVVKDKEGNKFIVDRNDKRLKTKELVGHSKGYVNVRDKEGNILNVSFDHPKYLSGEYKCLLKGKIIVKDKKGNKFSIDKDDIRYINGDLIGHSGKWINLDDKLYSVKQLEIKFNLSYRSILNRCKSEKWPNWKFSDI